LSDPPKYDLIICNPPFFFRQYKSPGELKKKAKHANESPDSWFKSFSARLNSSGHVCLVIPFENSAEWIESANACGYFCQHRLDVYSFRNDQVPIRSLLHFHAALHKPEIKRLDIYESTKVYTMEFLEFSGIQHQEYKA
jgi:tRNA1(Val) A37 N6-methylase TrmN6